MVKIAVLEDESSTRTLVCAVLRKLGYEVFEADNGADGLALILDVRPDLVISDVEMPQMTGFEVLAQLRQTPQTAHTPVILLTALDDRDSMRQGMTQGADDYISKPCKASELKQSVQAQLAKVAQRQATVAQQVDAQVNERVSEQVGDKMNQLAELYEKRLAREMGKSWDAQTSGSRDQNFESAFVLYTDWQNAHEFAAKLSSEEMGQIARNLYAQSSDTAHLFGAACLQFVAEDLVAIFADGDNTTEDGRAADSRVARATLGLVGAIGRCKSFVSNQFAGRGLPALRIGLTLHAGPVSLASLHNPLAQTAPQMVPVGEAVSVAANLRNGSPPVYWLVAATDEAVAALPDMFRLGASDTVTLAGDKEVRLTALLGPGPALVALGVVSGSGDSWV